MSNQTKKGLRFSRHFTKDGRRPYDQFKYDKRTSVIRNPDGEVVFEMKDVEVPEGWSQIATDILAQKYFRKAGVPGDDGSEGSETSVKQVVHRMVNCWKTWGERHEYFASPKDAEIFYDELAYCMLNQACVPNSPQWFNTGLHESYGITGKPQGHYFVNPKTGKVQKSTSAYERPQPHACARYNTLLFTNQGILKIRDIVENNWPGLKIFDGKEWSQLLAVKNNGVKKLYRATLSNGNFLEFTGDHLVWACDKRIADGGSYSWQQFETLLGKKVQQTALSHAVPEIALVHEMAEEAGSLKQPFQFTRQLMQTDALDTDNASRKAAYARAALAGWIVGHGYYDKNTPRNEASAFGAITVNEDEYAHVTRLFEALFGTYKTVIRKSIDDLYRIIKLDGQQADSFADAYELHQPALTAHVPEKIMRGSIPERCLFLQSLFQTKGGIRNRQEKGRLGGEVILTSISEDLVHEVQQLLLSLGIFAEVSVVKGDREAHQHSFQLTIACESEREKYAQLIGFVSKEKNTLLQHLNDRISGRQKETTSELTVVSIDFIGEEEVYDVQTASAQFAANGVTIHNCFILSVDDDLVNDGGIMDLWVREARIFKYGSGVGSNFSKIRAEGEILSGGGSSSGLMSFLKIGDRAAGAIKSGGTTRRAAKMVCLDLDHPEVIEFIDWKVEEEKKVAALMEAGFKGGYEGEAYLTVSGQNSNNSVRIPNSFFHKLSEDADWEMKARTTGKTMRSIPAKDLWNKIAYAAWRCADPGTQYDTTINEWHTCPAGGRINASNPCSEYMFLDNTACNLASINLRKFFDPEEGRFDVDSLEHTIRLWTVVLEISVLMAQFPSREVAKLSYDYRTLGLGFANLGSTLMVNGIPYDSEEARAIGGAIAAIMTGTAYRTSAEMAEALGPFNKFEDNKKAMMRVMRNHRAAAYDAADAYEDLEIKPQGIKAQHCPDYLLKAATNAWDQAVQMGEKYGYRNAQTTVIAPTGTIGLVMDCDTTGVEPDFALVKFKKLSGGGYFKIINQSIPLALSHLGYKPNEVKAIVDYAKGTGTFLGAPFINHQTLSEKGFLAEELKMLDHAVKTAFEIGFVFNVYTLGEPCLKRLGFSPDTYKSPDFSLLEALGFTEEQIEKANDYVCGTMTVEGAPHLKKEHLPVFDCANKCGKKGERFIHAHGHIRMMGAVQPFISGAISKTINLPNEATVAEIEDAYRLSWEQGLKACALYRDGSKLSQPLSNKSDKKKKTKKDGLEDAVAELLPQVNKLTIDELLEEITHRLQQSPDTKLMRKLSGIVQRKQLPAKRRGFTQKAKVGGQAIFLRTGEYGDGTLGEIFIDMAKEGATMRSMLNCFAIAISIGLQYGVPLEEFVDKFVFTRFEPAGMVEHPNIKSATSIVDYIFRVLGYEYLMRSDLVHIPDESPEQTPSELKIKARPIPEETTRQSHIAPREKISASGGKNTTDEFLTSLQSDAPACNVCGHITIRNGTCYKCLNCGNSMGCS